jgi:hypothetical protein
MHKSFIDYKILGILDGGLWNLFFILSQSLLHSLLPNPSLYFMVSEISFVWQKNKTYLKSLQWISIFMYKFLIICVGEAARIGAG